jgi:hypothetical protein
MRESFETIKYALLASAARAFEKFWSHIGMRGSVEECEVTGMGMAIRLAFWSASISATEMQAYYEHMIWYQRSKSKWPRNQACEIWNSTEGYQQISIVEKIEIWQERRQTTRQPNRLANLSVSGHILWNRQSKLWIWRKLWNVNRFEAVAKPLVESEGTENCCEAIMKRISVWCWYAAKNINVTSKRHIITQWRSESSAAARAL